MTSRTLIAIFVNIKIKLFYGTLMVRGLTVNQVYGVKSYGGSSPPCRAKGDLEPNQTRSLLGRLTPLLDCIRGFRSVAQPGRAYALGA